MFAPTPLRVRLPFRSEDEFVDQYGAHVGRDGFFLATRAPKPVGAQLLFDLVLADGSGGTHAGLLAGLPARVRILGVDVARPPTPHAERIPLLAEETARLAGRTLPGGELHLVDHTGARYGAVTEECIDAVRLVARSEGMLLDPVYSGKAMAGLRAAVREGRISGTVVFLHTGGAPALFADDYAGALG